MRTLLSARRSRQPLPLSNTVERQLLIIIQTYQIVVGIYTVFVNGSGPELSSGGEVSCLATGQIRQGVRILH